ncbi:MAG: hypothetical protein ACFB02_12535 [Mastigocoleus sp.]
MYYNSLQAPYFLFVLGLFIAITSGAAFSETLKIIVQTWQNLVKKQEEATISIKSCLLPFLGVSNGLGLFMCSGLAIFGVPNIIACAIGIPLTFLTSLLLWKQLKSMMTYAEQKGMVSFDLDSIF